MKKNYRLGIDMGSTSLGWCMVELDEHKEPIGIIDLGVRIFSDGRDDKSKKPLSVARREHRSTRRNLDRSRDRRKELWSYLEEISFIPKDQDERKVLIDQNPYYLRSKGLDEELSIYEFARAIIHLSKRRGFKSNRKDLAKEKKTKLTDALENLKEGLSESGSRTIGEFLYYKQKGVKEHKRSSVRFNYDEKETDKELIFPTRALIEDEFNQLFDTQAKYHRELTDKVREMLYDIIFYQRPLKAQTVGKCYFESDEFRASKASPAFQEFRLWQEINNLKLINKNTFDELELTAEQKIKLFNELSKVREKTFTAMRRSILGRDQAEQFEFNFEGRSRSGFKGNETNHLFRANKLLDFWEEINEDRKEEVVSLIINSELEDEEVKSRLLNMELPTLTEGQIEDLININFPDGYGRLSVRAIRNILPHLREGMIYSEACTAAGYNHSDDYTGEVFTDGDLPYYGAVLDKEVIELQRKTHDKDADDYGKINNPTVHIALNQLRQLVNALSKRYGAPEQIVIELAREIKHSEKKRKEIDDIIKKNTKENERIAEELDRLGIANNYDNRTLYKLWEELSSNPLERRCVYSGKQINVEDLFNIHNPKFEVEHILPKSRTFDDSFANKTISSREANRVKGERSPYEAFGSNSGEYSWDEILERAGNLPKNKRWRFQPNAMKRFDDESEVLARMLNDTRYMSRVAKKYMNFVSGKNNVWVVTGKLTSDLRRLWGFNSILSDDNIVDIKAKKERADHRHHAIDAFVIAMTSRSFVQRYSTTIKRSKDRFIEQLEKPYSDFSHESFRERVENIVVSYKPDQPNPHKLRSRNQTAGELTLDTTFNFYEEDENDSSRAWYTIRKPIADIKHKDVENIISDRFRDELTALSEGLSEKELTDKLTEWGKKNNVKKLKVKQRFSKKGMIPVLDQEGHPFKYVTSAENIYIDIYQPDPSDLKSRWQMEIVSSYNAHQPDFSPEWKKEFPKAKLIMRLYKNDIVAFDNDAGGRELRRLKKSSGRVVYLRELNVAYKPSHLENIGEQYSARQLQERNACKAGVDILGRYFDPGRKDKIDEYNRN